MIDDPQGSVASIPAPHRIQPPPQTASSPGPETALLTVHSPSIGSKNSETGSEKPTPSRHDSGSGTYRDYSSETPLAPSPRRLITPYSPVTPTSAQMESQAGPSQSQSMNSVGTFTSQDGLLSPPSASPSLSQRRRVKNAPPPVAIDLPTRADVQAAHAVAVAEEEGLRGGWVMSMESLAASSRPSLNDGRRRSTLASIPGVNALRSSGVPGMGRRSSGTSVSGAQEHEMEDIDLEGGHKERFGTPSPVSYAEDGSPIKSLGSAVPRAGSPFGPRSSTSTMGEQPVVAGYTRTPSPLRIHTDQVTPKARAPAQDFFSAQPEQEQAESHHESKQGKTPISTTAAPPPPPPPAIQTTSAHEKNKDSLDQVDLMDETTPIRETSTSSLTNGNTTTSIPPPSITAP